MRELRAYFPDRSINEQGFEPVIDEFRRAEIRTVENISCSGDCGTFRGVFEEPLDESVLEGNEEIVEYQRLSESPPEYLIVLSPSLPWALLDDCPATLICEHEVVFRDDGIEVKAIMSQRLIEKLSSHIAQSDISCEILSIGKYQGQSDNLTDSLTGRQRDVLVHAHQQGYYDVPRQTTLSELANDLEIDESTVAEHLRRAENNMFTHVLGEKC